MHSPDLQRTPGWEQRFAQTLQGWHGRPYVLGESDCFRFACAVVQALTGQDLWSPWAGQYRTKRQALRHIFIYGGTFTLAASRLFGSEPVAMAQARRGDIAEFAGDGEQHLGVVCGSTVTIPHEKGLLHLSRSACAHAWRIG